MVSGIAFFEVSLRVVEMLGTVEFIGGSSGTISSMVVISELYLSLVSTLEGSFDFVTLVRIKIIFGSVILFVMLTWWNSH